jgi:DNA repair exonuclease SbcCD ATPase subunit
MPNPVSHADTPRGGSEPDRLSRLLATRTRDKSSQDTPLPAGLNGLGRERMTPSEVASTTSEMNELELLRRENVDLRRSCSELHEMVEELRQLEESWGRQQREYEGLLEEKSEVIRSLHQKVQEMQEAVGKPLTPAPREEELLSLHDELEQERRQLEEDEASLMRQMRDMELQMARERADLARQRNELQRLHIEVHHELELAARDATLRERLAPLQRRLQDTVHRKGAAPTQVFQQPPQAQPQQPQPTEEAPPQRPRSSQSGVFRRLFGG